MSRLFNYPVITIGAIIVIGAIVAMLMSCVGARPEDQHPLACDLGSSSSAGDPGPDLPPPADLPADCDATVGGRVLVVGLDVATGDGPTVVYMHGTYETPEGVLATDSAAQAVAAAVEGEGGVLLLPRGRGWWLPGGPWPWGAVTGDAAWMAADAALVEAALACVPGDPDRVSVAGFSAGAIAAAYLGELRPWASVVLWSGGVQPADRPALPDAPGVMALHGGAGDLAQLREGAIDYAEQAPSLGVLCDHGGGHATAQGTDGAAFLRDARASGHPWAAAWPGGWTIDHYCGVVP